MSKPVMSRNKGWYNTFKVTRLYPCIKKGIHINLRRPQNHKHITVGLVDV